MQPLLFTSLLPAIFRGGKARAHPCTCLTLETSLDAQGVYATPHMEIFYVSLIQAGSYPGKALPHTSPWLLPE